MEMINAPIPGESLTREPNGQAFERPPQEVDPDKALVIHLDRLTDPTVMDSAIQALEMGMPLEDLVNAITRSAVASGIHSIDVSMLIAPAIHEVIKSQAILLNVEFDEGESFKDTDTEENQIRAGKARITTTPEMKEASMLEKSSPFKEEVRSSEPEVASKGLMGRT